MILDFLISKIFNLPNNSSIIVYQGGLGNQLFQYLLGEELRKTYKKKVFYYDMRDSYSNNHNSEVSNIFDLEIKKYIPSRKNFLVRRIILSPKFLKIMRFFFVRFSIKIISNLFTENIYKNIDLEEINKKQKLTIFFGTWHGLINHYKIDVDEVNFKFKTNINIPNIFNLKKDFISIHVRRGDYISSPKTSNFHGNLGINYYLKSINLVRERFGNIPVLLFSDDYKWIIKNLKNKIPNSVVISSNKYGFESDFFVMSNAKYFILSNSTFSWWAAFLGKKKNKFIVLPEFWFNDIKTNSDLIFKKWNYIIN